MKNLNITTGLLLMVTTVFAQQLPFSSQYYTNMFSSNPAYTGVSENTRAFLSHRSQWSGIAGSPQTTYLTIDGPIEAKNIGLGLKMYSDVTDITSRTGAFANYSYKLKINDENNLFIGLAAGVLNNRIDFTKAQVRDTDDPLLFNTVQNKTVFSADFGLAYIWKEKLELGFAMPQFIGNKIKYKDQNGDATYYKLARTYQGTVKYTFTVNEEKGMTAYPLIMVRGSEGSTIQYDINAVFDWRKYGWIGVTYHSNYAVAASIGVRYKNLAIGYAYDINMGKIKNYVGNSSELLLSYTFGQSKRSDEEVTKKDDGKDAVVDAAIAKLKSDSDSTKAEMERLRAELEKLKSGNSSSSNKERTESLTEQLMRVASSNDFVDDNGMSLGAGFYVVIGTFSNKANATKFKEANQIKGYNGVQIIQNHKTKVYYVYVKQHQKQEDAEAEQQKFKAEYPDVWIQKLE
ncbi:MAG: PorP/SprF family type IX secretion system membrane protein [Bacteroidia bacterium]|nr:PorP/SprF family type IX secretion system membrane protein [Bacteroidia bacterium]